MDEAIAAAGQQPENRHQLLLELKVTPADFDSWYQCAGGDASKWKTTTSHIRTQVNIMLMRMQKREEEKRKADAAAAKAAEQFNIAAASAANNIMAGSKEQLQAGRFPTSWPAVRKGKGGVAVPARGAGMGFAVSDAGRRTAQILPAVRRSHSACTRLILWRLKWALPRTLMLRWDLPRPLASHRVRLRTPQDLLA